MKGEYSIPPIVNTRINTVAEIVWHQEVNKGVMHSEDT